MIPCQLRPNYFRDIDLCDESLKDSVYFTPQQVADVIDGVFYAHSRKHENRLNYFDEWLDMPIELRDMK